MTISTANVDAGGDSPRLARAQIKETIDTVNNLETSAGSAGVGFIQSGTGAVATTVQTKLRESYSVDDSGAAGDGVTDDTTDVVTDTGTNGVYAKVLGKTYLIRQSGLEVSAGFIGTHPDSTLKNSTADERVVLFNDDGSARPANIRVENLNVLQTGTQNTDNTSSIYFSAVDNSHVSGNHVVGTLGISSQYGSATLGPYAGDPATESQPKRQGRGNIYSFNDVDASSMAFEIFSALYHKYIGNRAYRASGTATSHAYRVTGYPGMPCDYNALVGNSADSYANGLSLQTAAHYNSFAAMQFSNLSGNGFSQSDNTTYSTDHSGFNYAQFVVNTCVNGLYAANPNYNYYNAIVRNASGTGVWLDVTANYGDKQHCLLDAVVKDCAAAALIETDNNILRITAADLTSNAITISGANNIVDVVVDGVVNAASRFSLVVSGNKNIVRCHAANNSSPATSDISVTGDDNDITVYAATGTSCSGARNTLRGHLGVVTSLAGATDTILQGTITSITRGGTNTDYTGLRYGKGRGLINGTTTDANGDVTVTATSIPSGLTVYNVTAQYISSGGTSRFIVLKSASVAAGTLTMVLNFKKDDGTNAATEAVSAFYQYEAY